jgi:hypothetical protein
VPDLRGLFLRGLGGNSAAISVMQEDAGRNVKGTFGTEALFSGTTGNAPFSGAFYWSRGDNRGHIASNWIEPMNEVVAFDASRSWGAEHAANEFRPVNTAVRYLIRALP